MRKLLATSALLLTAACASAPEFTVSPSPHEGVTRYAMKKVRCEDDCMYWLRAWDIDGESNAQLVFRTSTFGWPYIDSAWVEGDRVDITEIDADVFSCAGKCIMNEWVGISLTMDEVAELANRGRPYAGVLSGAGARIPFEVPTAYFARFLELYQTNNSPSLS